MVLHPQEASIQAGGQHLGEVGGRIVAEVFLGLMEKDPSSYLRNDPTWKPFLEAATSNDFTVPDLIKFSEHGLQVTDIPGRPGPATDDQGNTESGGDDA